MRSFLSRYWFSAALSGLFVLALPGLALFVLTLAGAQGAVNAWLDEQLALSYHLPVPGWVASLLLLVPIAILLLYFLKLKRRPLSVPSTFLWKKSIEDLHVNSLLQWLRQNVLLLLQLLAVLAMIYGVMAFRLHRRGGEGHHFILMVDNSASMAATDVAPNRLERAKVEALEAINSYADSDVGMVIAFNSSAEILQSFTTNKNLLRQAVREIAPTQRPTRIEEAISLAESLANPLRSTEDVASQPENVEPGKERTYVPPKGIPTTVHLFSDGRFPDLSDSALANLHSRIAGNESALGNLQIQFHLAGKPGAEEVDNLGLVTLNAIRDDNDPTRVQVFARVLNFRAKETAARLQLEVVKDGSLQKVYEKSVHLPARKVTNESDHDKDPAAATDTPGEASATFEVSDIDDRADTVMHVRLVDVNDQFPLDDEAWLALGVARKARVAIVGKLNEILQKFFDADEVRQVADVAYFNQEDLDKDVYRKPAFSGGFDLVIFDRCAPTQEKEMPAANCFFIGAAPPPWQTRDLEPVEDPHITGWTSNHPVLRDLRALYTVEIYQALKVKNLPKRTPLLIEGRRIEAGRNIDLPLLLTLNRNAFTDLVLTFPIITDQGGWNTTWPIQASFPLFLRNILYTLGNLSEAASEETVQPGQIKTLRPDRYFKQIEVRAPDGSREVLSHEERNLRPDFLYGKTDRVGAYRFAGPGDAARTFTVNLLDAEESNIEPRSVFSIGSDRIEAGPATGQTRETWKWFALAALVFLMIEWYIYNRRVYV